MSQVGSIGFMTLKMMEPTVTTDSCDAVVQLRHGAGY
jgi:hypothetical protein